MNAERLAVRVSTGTEPRIEAAQLPTLGSVVVGGIAKALRIVRFDTGKAVRVELGGEAIAKHVEQRSRERGIVEDEPIVVPVARGIAQPGSIEATRR